MKRATLSMCLIVGCGAGASDPQLTGFSPAAVGTDALPLVATVLGTHLEPSLSIQLDDDSRAADWPVRASLGTTELSELKLSSGTELQVTVPTSLAPGVYDFELQLGPGRSAKLPAALTISAGAGVIASDGNRCAATEFGAAEPVVVEGMGARYLWSPALSADSRTLYFAVQNGGTAEIWKATRPDRGTTFSDITLVPDPSLTGDNSTPFPSADGRTLYFAGGATTVGGPRDLYVSTRSDANAAFGTARPLSELNSTAMDQMPWVSADELSILFLSQRDGTLRPWLATRASRTASFDPPAPLPLTESFGPGGRVFPTPDGLGLYYSLPSESLLNGSDIWYTTRSSPSAPFGASTNLWQLSTAQSEMHVALSSDGAELFFVSQTPLGNALFRAQCNPL